RDACAHGWRQRLVRSIPVDLSGADRPAPDVHLRFARPAQIDSRIRIGDRHLNHASRMVLLLGPVVTDDRHRRIDERCALDAPVEPEDEILELAFGPETLLPLRLAFSVVIYDTVRHTPVTVVPGGDLPAREILA